MGAVREWKAKKENGHADPKIHIRKFEEPRMVRMIFKKKKKVTELTLPTFTFPLIPTD